LVARMRGNEPSGPRFLSLASLPHAPTHHSLSPSPSLPPTAAQDMEQRQQHGGPERSGTPRSAGPHRPARIAPLASSRPRLQAAGAFERALLNPTASQSTTIPADGQ
jgi:hypothetical protein